MSCLGKGDLNHISWFNTIYWHICKFGVVTRIAKPNSKQIPTKEKKATRWNLEKMLEVCALGENKRHT
jgi:hypothetical protein